ncbi:MAG: molybdate ABC transporter substrate-binding protein [Pseudomonadota bacterium]|nr:molybdate ABC transporter substrate-binding protein [Pseudomonadota bacterium]
MDKIKLFSYFFIFQLFYSAQVFADELRIAVSSNFYPALKEIVKSYAFYQNDSLGQKHDVVLIPGSSGKHFAQIMNGAPFDIFFSADDVRPLLLEKNGKAINKSRHTYALGQLVLWSPIDDLIDKKASILQSKDFRFIAIANPKIAPYGEATKEALISMNLWKSLEQKLIRGENIAQTFQFVNSGNAKLGFISFSQIVNSSYEVNGSYWEVPKSLYEPIEQQVVLLNESFLAEDFLSYLSSEESQNIISRFGYDLP